jgi:hypothetical protein
MNYRLLSILPLVVLAAACANPDDDDATDSEDVIRATKVSGYDLAGPKALPGNKAGSEVCIQVLSEEQAACERVQGTTIRANGCKHLCSKPIAPRGKTAGYDFAGFKQLSADKVPVEFCIQVLSEEQAACERAGGVTSGANGCAHLCSAPIAPQGKGAGFDLTGFKILPNASASTDVCAAVVSKVQEQCTRVKGKLSHVDGCADLCSLPL